MGNSFLYKTTKLRTLR